MSGELVKRSRDQFSAFGRDPEVRGLAHDAGLELVTGDMRAALAHRELIRVERFTYERMGADSRVADEAMRRLHENPELSKPLLAKTLTDYQRACESIVARRFLR